MKIVTTPALTGVILLGASCAAPQVEQINKPVTEIYWSDGDSGRIDGMKFRLANVDAPETGGVGARGGAKCEGERVLGYVAKEYMVNLTRMKPLEIVASYGADRYGREVIEAVSWRIGRCLSWCKRRSS